MASAGSLYSPPPRRKAAIQMSDLTARESAKTVPVKDKIEILFRKARPLSDPHVRYPGFKPEVTTLTKGTVLAAGTRALDCDILFERDVAVMMRDGITVYADIFRPVSGKKLPAIIAWSPYGKEQGNQLLDDVPMRAGVPKNAVSNLQKFEGPDPAYWCTHGYAVVNPDSRGAYNSEGDVYFWGTQDAHDGYDFIEAIAALEWSNGKIAFSGNSWLAIAQWFIASERPPHLAAIAPWEGLTDLYRHDVQRGGIPDAGFNEYMVSLTTGNNCVEDVPAMVAKYPLMNSYWEDKAAKLERIDVPAYVVASWTNGIHTPGSFEGFCRIASKQKWLRVHNTMEWPDYYTPEYVEDLRKFFDRYLRGIENGWESTPKVRLSVLDPTAKDQVNRPEEEFPLARTYYQKLYLDGPSKLLTHAAPKSEMAVRYRADDNQGKATFSFTFDKDTELTGFLKLRLWVEAVGSDDVDLFVLVEKLDTAGSPAPVPMINAPVDVPALRYPGPSGRLRVSHRELDLHRSTEAVPYHTHRIEELLSPGQIVPVDIPIKPIGMMWHASEQLRVTIAGYNLTPTHAPGLVPRPPRLRNRGEHIIHTGGKYDSYLLVPVIPT